MLAFLFLLPGWFGSEGAESAEAKAAGVLHTSAGLELQPCTCKRTEKTARNSSTAQKGNVEQDHILVPVHDPLDLRRRVFLYVRRGNSPRWIKNNINIY